MKRSNLYHDKLEHTGGNEKAVKKINLVEYYRQDSIFYQLNKKDLLGSFQ